jgi:hypothetical protein
MMYAATPADIIIRATQIPTIVATSSRVSLHVRIPGPSPRSELTLSLGSSFTRSSPNPGSSDGTLWGLHSAIVHYGWLVG